MERTELHTRETLLGRLRDRHDEASWEAFIGYYEPYIAAVVRNAGAPKDAVSDIVQTVLLTAWKKLPEFEYDPEKGRFRYWLNTVTLNAVRKHFRQEGRLAKAMSGPVNERLERFLSQEGRAEIEAVSEREWKVHVAKLAWSKVAPRLSDNVRETFQRILSGDDVEAIAKDMGLAKNTVYVYRQRVEKRMAREISRLTSELS